MADYIELEEGTGFLELEEGTGLLLREEAGGVDRSAEFTADAQFNILAATPPAGGATWKVGTITVPSSTGSMAITGLGGTPKAVFFFGTNWLTEDSSDTASGRGVFRGMAGPRWDSPSTIVQNCAFVGPPGDQHVMDNNCIRAFTTAGNGTNLHAANFTSFDGDGFTIDWVLAAAGGYKVVYVALMQATDVGAYLGQTATIALGWKAGAALVHGAWGGPSIAGTDRTQEFYGSAAFPGSSGWMSAGLTAYTLPTAPGGGQRNINTYRANPTSLVAQGGRFIGPFLTASDVRMFPAGGGLTDFTYDPQSSDNAGMVVMWDDEGNATGRLTPATSTAGTYVVAGLPFAPGLLIAYSISNEPGGQQTGTPARGAIGFSVVTTNYQWSALADGTVSGRGAFQSFQRGFTDTVDGANVHAGTVELTDDGFVLTTEEDDASPSSWVWHAFGYPERTTMWLPHIYRRVLG